MYIQPATAKPDLSEIEEMHVTELGIFIDDPHTDRQNMTARFAGEYKFDIAYNIDLKYQATGFELAYTIKHFYKIGNAEPVPVGDVISVGPPQYLLPGKHTLPVDYSFSATLAAGGKVWYYSVWEWNKNVKVYPELKQNSVNIHIVSQEQAPASNTKGWMLFDAVNQVVKSITGGASRIKSSFLQYRTATQMADGGFALYLLNNGFSLRNFDAEKRPLSLSLKTVLQSLKAHANIGFGIERTGGRDVLRIEPVDYFYRDRQIVIIEETESYEEESARELVYNEVEIGYNKYKADGFNTLDEFNTRHEYLTTIKSHKNKLIAKSDFIASGYSIEDVRRQQYEETPRDSYTGDEDPFIIALAREAGGDMLRTERNEAFAIVSGLISPETAYNLRLSPKRMLIAQTRWLAGALAYKPDADMIRNIFVDKNGELVTQFSPLEPHPLGDEEKQSWKEKEAESIAKLLAGREPIYRPDWVRVKCSMRPDEVLMINEAMRGALDESKNYGYILVRSPKGEYNAVWPYKLTYNFASEKCELVGLKRFSNPTSPADDCCPALAVNGCVLLINGRRLIL